MKQKRKWDSSAQGESETAVYNVQKCTFNFGLGLCHSFSKLLLEVEGL